MSIEDNTKSAYTSFEGEQSCFPKLATRGGPNSMYAATSGSRFDNRILPGDYSKPGGTVNYACPKGRECLFPFENIFIPCPPGTYDADGYFSC